MAENNENENPDVVDESIVVAHCHEILPSSDCNKENIDSNGGTDSVVRFNFESSDDRFAEYDTQSEMPLPQLLKLHVKQLVSGFEFGEATKRRAQENMKHARERSKNEQRTQELGGNLTQPDDDSTRPCCSKDLETEHKTPHSRKRQRLSELRRNSNDVDFCTGERRIPDCLVNYPECREVWTFMIFKEEAGLKLRNPRLFNDFKSVTPRMRAILLDWLMEVSAVYHLRRVTYYLSVDYFDRFLSIRTDIPKSLLQLVGITCLYIAAKVEEIYPPNLGEFTYVCDGACKAGELVSCELLILNSLGWEVVLATPSDWLNLYMQLHFKSQDITKCHLNMDFNKDFIFPQYSAYQFTRASQLMDLFSLDPGFLKFAYSVVAAAAMYFMYGEEVALSVSGLSWLQLGPCVEYMEAFHNVIKDTPDPRLESLIGGPDPEEQNSRGGNGLLKRLQCAPQTENYSFQTHVASMDYFEKATILRLSRLTRQKVNFPSPPIDLVAADDPASEPSANAKQDEPVIVDSTDRNSNDADDIIDLTSLEKLKPEEVPFDANLMSLDEIFELLLSQDDRNSTNE